jgi:hypothetical protein
MLPEEQKVEVQLVDDIKHEYTVKVRSAVKTEKDSPIS